MAAGLAVAFDRIAVAWDHTAPAARAVGDALPMLQAAASVRIVTATNRRSLEELVSGFALVAHLEEHGISATFETVMIDDSSVVKLLAAHGEGPQHRSAGDGRLWALRLSEFVWGRDKNGHGAATVLGYDVALVAGPRASSVVLHHTQAAPAERLYACPSID